MKFNLFTKLFNSDKMVIKQWTNINTNKRGIQKINDYSTTKSQ